MKQLFSAKVANASHPMDLFVRWWTYEELFSAELDLIAAFSDIIDVSIVWLFYYIFFNLFYKCNIATPAPRSIEEYLVLEICKSLIPSSETFKKVKGRDNWQLKLNITRIVIT